MASRPKVGGWLQGKTIRKGGVGSSTSTTRSSTPQVQSTSSTVFGGGVKDPSGRTSEYFSMDDQCPRVLSQNVRVLRKLAFMPQTFEDLSVEKEVAIRRRIAKEFNKRREDFSDLGTYNDYLEEVEDITFNLINDVDIAKTEARIQAYREENAALIELNIQREEAYVQALKEQEEADRRERENRAMELRREEEEEREEREKGKKEIIDKLETSDKSALKIISKSRANAAKKSSARSASASVLQSNAQLLRSRAAQSTVIPDAPHVPLDDDWYAYEDLYEVRSGGYQDYLSEAVRKDREGIMRGGGYRIEEAWQRALQCAVAALDLPPLSGLPTILPTNGSSDVILNPT
ncbi:hypothetical protein C0989_004523 [Termitomyces sp. Mn162]|nr:hypothetical protein C0989_004523 [Termitomyces sp. Mn162]